MMTTPARVRLLAALVLPLLPATCLAQHLTPNGNPTGAPSATPTGKTIGVTLQPNPATIVAPQDSPWLLKALEALGYKDSNISYSTMAGDYSLDDYFAFANRSPGAHRYGFNINGHRITGEAGAGIDLDYEPKGNDPKGSDLHWIQVIYTNSPSNFGKNHGANLGDGFYAYIDDARNPGNNPAYDLHGTANSQGFIDDPFRTPTLGLVWEAQTFTMTDTIGTTAAATTLEIETGVEWGFKGASVPEPSSLAMAGTAALAGLGAWWWLRGRQPRTAAS